MKALQIKVPATTANLGPGYDLIGCALSMSNQFDFRIAEQLSVEFHGPRASECSFKLDHDSLIWKAFERVYQSCGQAPPYFHLSQSVSIPPARGLGSSSSAIVAGLLAANHWLNQALSNDELLQLATELEGHPDNVAPALLGGCILNHPDASWTRIPIAPSLHWIVCIPEFELSTHQARTVVPQKTTLSDAICNMAYLSSLVLGLSLNDHQLIGKGLQDTLHQPYRQTLVPGMPEVIQAAIAAGALGAVLSGAGPTLLALSEDKPAQIGLAMCEKWSEFKIQAEFVSCVIDPQGAICLD